ncbi:Uncharacterised protein [Actinobacillus pleuropneumoniae]|nr:Uncharacterised protein [Actinobacillus pleuropneumoniae]
MENVSALFVVFYRRTTSESSIIDWFKARRENEKER